MNVFDSVFATKKMTVEMVCFVEKSIATLALERFEQVVDVFAVWLLYRRSFTAF